MNNCTYNENCTKRAKWVDNLDNGYCDDHVRGLRLVHLVEVHHIEFNTPYLSTDDFSNDNDFTKYIWE